MAINPDHLCDASNVHANPTTISRVLTPASEAELIGILRQAWGDREPVTLQAGQTGVTAGCVPTEGGIVLRTEKLLRLPERLGYAFHTTTTIQGEVTFGLRKDKRRALLPPGISLATLDTLLQPHGIMYLPNPTETAALLGGTVATNASGSRSFAFGATRNHIMGLQIILPVGEPLTIARGQYTAWDGELEFQTDSGKPFHVPTPTYSLFPGKNAAGLYSGRTMDLVDLFVGSEGILGVLSEIELQVVPRRAIETGIYFFRTTENALHFVEDVAENLKYGKNNTTPVAQGIISLEYYDTNSLQLTREPIPSGAIAAVQYEFFEGDLLTPEQLERYANSSNALENWHDGRVLPLRHKVPEAINAVVRKHGTRKVSTDFAVVNQRFGSALDLYAEMQDQFAKACTGTEITSALFGHIGDYHLHLNLIPRNEQEVAVAKALYEFMVEKIVRWGGTISAEHGIGKTKVPYLQKMLGKEGMDEIRAVKRILDPHFLLNRGNMVGYNELV